MANKAVRQQWLYTDNIRENSIFLAQMELTWNDRNPVLLQKCHVDGWYQLPILVRQYLLSI